MRRGLGEEYFCYPPVNTEGETRTLTNPSHFDSNTWPLVQSISKANQFDNKFRKCNLSVGTVNDKTYP